MQSSNAIQTKAKEKVTLHEDWVVVILGFLIIGVSLLGLVIPAPKLSWSNSDDLFTKILSAKNLAFIAIQFAATISISAFGALLTNKSVSGALKAFPLIFGITIIAVLLAGYSKVKELNLEAVIFSLSFGLLIGNLFNLPQWLRNALSTELFVKIGLVLLGTTILFSDILKAGALGLIQALVVVLSVWYFAYWLCKRFKLDDEITMMISSAVSICGVSAAIATAGAIKGDPKKLSYVISLVLVTAIPMMIIMPYVANYFHFPEKVTGAWLGGSIDTTGAVVAAGSLVGKTAQDISTIVKFAQNVLLGIAAFAISIYWSYTNQVDPNGQKVKPTVRVIWERFPKFVIGFMAASLLFSFFVQPEVREGLKESLKSIQTLWFVLAFTSIGLETKFSDLFNNESRRPLYAFSIAQGFNIIVTLIIAFILFSRFMKGGKRFLYLRFQ